MNEGMSSELLINVIRTLTSSASDDQRQLERERIEQGYEQSEKNIDKLLREHRADVMQCLSTFQSVSRSLTNSREQIRNVRNSLSLCKTFLQCRRDDLNKFWQENAQQKTVCDILRQIQQVKEVDKSIETRLENGEYKELVRVLKEADSLLKGPLDRLEGISQLKFIVSDNLKKTSNHIVSELLQCTVVEPFELQMLELAKNSKIRESKLGTTLIQRYPKKKLAQLDEQSLRRRLGDLLESLSAFNQVDLALEEMFARMPNLLLRLANETAKLVQINANGGGGGTADSTHLAQFAHILIAQLNGSSRLHSLLTAELEQFQHSSRKPPIQRFWAIAQEGLEEILAEHLLVWRNKKRGEEGAGGQRKLFSFENASFVSSVNASSRKKQIQLVCPADVYNVVAIFHKLSLFCREVESQTGEDCCQIAAFLHTFVAEAFFEQIRTDLELKTELALSGADLWTSLSEVPGHGAKVLACCVRVFELCEQINGYIMNMEKYSLRFASFWLLIMEHFIKAISDKYFQMTMLRQAQGDSLVEYPKLSAAWVLDEDISRLLKSLPSWTAVKASSTFSPGAEQIQTPFAGTSLATAVESEQEIRERTQRESEILISNLGTQKQLKQAELISNGEHVKVLACLHESLQWFVARMRQLIGGLSPRAQELLKTRIQISTTDGALVEQMLCEAINERIGTLEKLSDGILLILHLELRFHCFFHLLPIAQNQSGLSMLSQEEMDKDVMEFGRDLAQLHGTLQAHLCPSKLKYLFEGLAYLCASIFIHSCQYINRLSELGRKRICRAIFTVQKYLSQLSGRPETEMQRAQMFFDFLNKELDQLFTTIVERGAPFSFVEYSILLALLIRSHPALNSQPGALESATNQLREILTQRAGQQQRKKH